MAISKPFIRDPYNYDRRQASIDTQFKSNKPSKTQQSQKEEADINTIVKRFGLTGQLPNNVRMPQYGDFTGISDYQSALNAVLAANAAFNQYPAHIRERFRNSPELFVEFCLDENNREEAEKLGLVAKAVKIEPAAQGGVSPTEAGGKNPVEPAKPA